MYQSQLKGSQIRINLVTFIRSEMAKIEISTVLIYPAYIQLVAKCSSPSICAARATGWPSSSAFSTVLDHNALGGLHRICQFISSMKFFQSYELGAQNDLQHSPQFWMTTFLEGSPDGDPSASTAQTCIFLSDGLLSFWY